VRARTLTSPTGPRPRSSGFSLIELTVVLAVVSVLSLLVVPRLPLWDEGGRLNSAARQVVYAARLARSEAVTRAAAVDLVVGREDGSLKVAAGQEEVWADKLEKGIIVDGVLIRGAGLKQEPVIRFRADGRVREAAIYLRAGDKSLTLHLEPLSGQVQALQGRVVYDWAD